MRKFLFTTTLAGSTLLSVAQSDSSTVYLQMARTEQSKGHKLEALKQLEKAFAFNNSNKEVTEALATAYFDLRKYPQSLEKYLQLEKSGNKSAAVYKNLMQLSFNLRKFDDAIKYGNLLLKTDPSEKVNYYLGKSYYELENIGEAIKFLLKGEKEDPNNAELLYTIAHAYSDVSDYKNAIRYFQKALQIEPTQNRWIYEMALMYYGLNDDQSALKYMLEAADKGYKKDSEFLENLSTAYINAGKWEEGVQILIDALENRPNDMMLLNGIAQTYYDFKRWDDAIKYWDKVLALDNKNASALYMIGMTYMAKNEKEKGKDLVEKAIQMDPSLKNNKRQTGSTAL